MTSSLTADHPADDTIRILAASPRLSAARQRRLSQLMKKSRESTLSVKENDELESMLDEIDRKSFWMLAKALLKKRSSEQRRSIAK